MGYPMGTTVRNILMRIPLTAALIAMTALSACGGFRDSKINPLNWFGRSQPEAQANVATQAPVDQRPLVAQVLLVKVERSSTGAIVRATGLPPSQGWWDAELVALPIDENGVLTLEFHVFPPLTQTSVVNQPSREITAAYAISAFKLNSVTKVIVQGANNALSSGR
jgi:hypothetical protein